MHPVVKHLLRGAHAVGVKAVARALDSALEDVDAGAKEVSRRMTRARGRIKDIEKRATEQLPDDDDDDDEDDEDDDEDAMTNDAATTEGTVSPRELAGMIRRASDCYLWVPYGVGEGCYVRVAHTTAHNIVEDAYESHCGEIFAHMEKGELYIGDEAVTESDAPPASEPGTEPLSET
jgi:hypothetical protein